MDYNMKIYEYEKAIQLLRDKLVLLIEVYNNLNRLIPSINNIVSVDNTTYNQTEILDMLDELTSEYTTIRNVILPRMEENYGVLLQSVNRGEINGS